MADEVNLTNDSKYRVALDLMYKIASVEANAPNKDERKDRKYWLSLYEQCRGVVVEGKSTKAVLGVQGQAGASAKW